MLTGIITAVAVLGGLGAGLGLLLAAADRVFAVEEDPRLRRLVDALPGVNCGGCGFPGCAAYAAAVLEGSTVVGACPVGGEASAAKMARIMGVEKPKARVRQVALVRCTGGGRDKKRYEYDGYSDCRAAAQVPGGGELACAYGCRGLGACVNACPFGAIAVEDGAARVDEDRCRGCLQCIPACPRNLITVVPYGTDVSVLCANADKGAEARTVCADGCIACGLCKKACPNGAVSLAGNCAVIDYDKCDACGKCVDTCPRHLIRKSAMPAR